jgi:hypothetical protein
MNEISSDGDRGQSRDSVSLPGSSPKNLPLPQFERFFYLVSESAVDRYLAADRQTTASQMGRAQAGARHCRKKQRSASNPIYKFHRRGKSSKGKNISVTSRYLKRNRWWKINLNRSNGVILKHYLGE